MAHGNARPRHFVVYREKTMRMGEAVALAGAGVTEQAAFGRVAIGWPIERAVEQPMRNQIRRLKREG